MAELSNLKPIQTKYKGYHFRSRLEARWAVFFEEMGLDWSYEVEGFQLPSGAWYLPDFFVRNPKDCFDYWYEVKPKGSPHCPKVKEFNSLLPSDTDFFYQGENNLTETVVIKPQLIIQLNGDPLDFGIAMCPRCKKISYENPLFDQLHDNFVNEYNCEQCDIAKCGGGTFLETRSDGSEFYWHKGVMVNLNLNDEYFVASLACEIVDAGIKAREARFDGSNSQ